MRTVRFYKTIALGVALSISATLSFADDAQTCLDRNAEETARLEACNTALQSSSDAKLLVARGRIYERQDNYELALQDFNQALGLDPSNLTALERRMVVLRDQGSFEQSLIDARALVERDPAEEFYHYYLGEVLQELGQYDDALAAYADASEIDPEYYWPYVGRGQTLRKMGRASEAAEAFQQATYRRAFASYARNQVVDLYEELGDTGAIGEHFLFRYTLNPNQLSLRDWLRGNVWTKMPEANLSPSEWAPPSQGMEYFTIRSKVDERDDMTKSIEDLIVFFGGEVYPKADNALIERYVYGAPEGEYFPVVREITQVREGNIPEETRTPATYRGLFPSEVFPFGPLGPAVRVEYDGLDAFWPLSDGTKLEGTGRYLGICPEEINIPARMMGCKSGMASVELGTIEWTGEIGAETTHVPMGVFETHTFYLSQKGEVKILGRSKELTMDVKFWIDPELGTWVRRHVFMGEDFVLSQAMRPQSQW